MYVRTYVRELDVTWPSDILVIHDFGEFGKWLYMHTLWVVLSGAEWMIHSNVIFFSGLCES